MKALVLAAGYGKRLEPLTKAVPKPMVPVANKPIMQYNLELIKKYGIKEACANIHYFPEQVESYFHDGSGFGLNLKYSFEEELLGTAGGVRRMFEIMKIKDTFLVISSDALTDLNISRMYDAHKKKNALATIALCPVDETSQYGVVVLDGNDKITAFQEKPKREEALSHLANTGIYMFEPEVINMIPKNTFYDFGNQVFPELVKKSAPFYGYKMVEYWNDVGALEQLRLANADVLKGIVRAEVNAKRIDRGTWVGKNVEIDKSAKFDGTIILGDKSVIGKNVQIFGNVSIGSHCVIGDNSIIKNSVIWSDTRVGEGVTITSSIIGSWCTIGAKSKIDEHSIISNRITINQGTRVEAETKLGPPL